MTTGTSRGASTGHSGPPLSLVIPAFNEEARLPTTLAALQAGLPDADSGAVEVIVVDNGSQDATAEIVRTVARQSPFPWLRLLQLRERGKGRAVQAGLLAASGRFRAFGDADLSWPVAGLLEMLPLLEQGWDVVAGSREGRGARRLAEPRGRHLMGRVFNRVVQVSVVGGIEDTQCGLKAFRAEAAEQIFRRQTVMGFGFDVEILYLARYLGFSVTELPLLWEHKEASRVQPVRDTLAMLGDVAAVRWNAWRGRYTPAPRAAETLPRPEGG